MNAENILKVADAIEQHAIADLGFNMTLLRGASDEWTPDTSGRSCGTVACIAGWTCAVANREGDTNNDYFDSAAEFLGLGAYSLDEGPHNLFFPGDPYWGAEPSQAVAVLRHLAATGKVDWSVALTPEA